MSIDEVLPEDPLRRLSVYELKRLRVATPGAVSQESQGQRPEVFS